MKVLDLDGLSLLSPPKAILAGGIALTRAWLARIRDAKAGRRLDLSSLGLAGQANSEVQRVFLEFQVHNFSIAIQVGHRSLLSMPEKVVIALWNGFACLIM